MNSNSESIARKIGIHMMRSVYHRTHLYKAIQGISINCQDTVTQSQGMIQGIACVKEKRYEEAITVFQQEKRRRLFSATVYGWLGYAILPLHGFKAAKPYLETCIFLDPDYWHAYETLGWGCYAVRQYSEALGFFRKAIAIRQDKISFYFGAGLSLMKMERYEEAIDDFIMCTQIEPYKLICWQRLAMCYEEMGDLDQSYKLRQWVQLRQPSNLGIPRISEDETRKLSDAN